MSVSNSGFLASEVQCPAFDPRILLRAGDIEVNPGPACNFCNKEFSSNSNPRICGADQCNEQCHSWEKCSGIKRSSARVWMCREHSTGPQLVAVCDDCGRTLSESAAKRARRCAEKGCQSICHRGKKCSRISRYCMDGVWKCLAHSGRRQSLESQPSS